MSIDVFRFKIFENCKDLVHGLSTRDGGVSNGAFDSLNLGMMVGDSPSNVNENIDRFCKIMEIPSSEICIAEQEHTDKVLVVNEGAGFENHFSGIDGFITSVDNVALMVRFADCQGVLIYDPVKKVVAAVHSGWRGVAQNIIGKTLRRMIEEFGCDPKNILVGIGPSLGPCCGEFTDPLKELPQFMHKYANGRHVDLWSCSYDQVLNEGVVAHNLELTRICTVCNDDKFFSFRVAKNAGHEKSGHMAGVIMMKN